jgi:hypothetical protein
MSRAILAALLLAGCDVAPIDPLMTDQCMRREIFAACMAALPRGPERVGTSNDWDEVVGACDNVAYYQARRRAAQIKPQCIAP